MATWKLYSSSSSAALLSWLVLSAGVASGLAGFVRRALDWRRESLNLNFRFGLGSGLLGAIPGNS